MTDKRQLKILGYCNFSKLESLMSRHFFKKMMLVSDEVTQEPRNIDELNDYLRKGNFTHVFIPDEHFHQIEGSLRGCCVPVIEMMDDHWVPWAIERKKNYIVQNGIRNAVVFSKRFLKPYKRIARFHPTIAGYDSDTFFDSGKERDIDILLSGCRGGENRWIYPVRNWLYEVVPEIGEREGIKVEILEHPENSFEDKRDHQKEYAELINRAKIATGGSSYWRLPLKKLYEIPASGAVLLSDLPFDDGDFFRGRILEIDPTKINTREDKDQIRKNIMETLGNYDSLRHQLQPFATENERYTRSYKYKSLEMRALISGIN